MSRGTQAVVFNAAAPRCDGRSGVRGRVQERYCRTCPCGDARARKVLDWAAAALVYPATAAAAGEDPRSGRAHEREPAGGQLWPSFVAAIVVLIPALMLLARWHDGRSSSVAQRAPVTRAAGLALDREVGVLTEISPALARPDPIEASRPVVRRVARLLEIGFAAVVVVSEDGAEATGVYAEKDGEPVAWWQDVRLDLRAEPSGIASAVFDAAPVTVFDVASSSLVSSRLASQVGAQSGGWVPMIAEERVVGVLVVASTQEKRAFSQDELTVLQALAAEAGIALERLRAMSALAEALQRSGCSRS
jgi:hypothetical protein